jgi:hypothetical protein
VPASDVTRISEIHPLWAVEGGRVTLRGSGFPVDQPRLPLVRVGALEAQVVHASPTALSLVVPDGIEGGSAAVRLADRPGETAFLEIGRPIAREVRQVDSPVIDRDGCVYVTISGRRGERVPEPIFQVSPDGARRAIAIGIPNATSLAFDRRGRLHVSSRFDGTVHRVLDDERVEMFASDLGSPCGLAFDANDVLHVGDRSGSILRVTADREVSVLATLPSSVAAYHLAFGPDGGLYVAVPTLCSRDAVFRIGPDGDVRVVFDGFGRPQGLAFDRQGFLYVVEAMAGGAGLLRLRVDRPDPEPEQVLAAAALVGVAIDPRGGLVVASHDTVYRLDVPIKPVQL